MAKVVADATLFHTRCQDQDFQLKEKSSLQAMMKFTRASMKWVYTRIFSEAYMPMLLGKRADTLRDNEDHDSVIVEHDDFIKGVMEYNREIVKYFIKRGVSVILLFRRNLLWRLISVLANAYDREAKLLNGTHKLHVHSKQEAEFLAAYKPVINVTFLIPNLNQIEEVTRDAVKFFRSTHHIVLCYEDLISDQKGMVEVQKFLKVPPRQLKSQQVKIHTQPLSDHVQNWNEVYKKLKGTKYESFLNESDYDL